MIRLGCFCCQQYIKPSKDGAAEKTENSECGSNSLLETVANSFHERRPG